MPTNPRLIQEYQELGAAAPTALTPDHFYQYFATFATIAAAGSATTAVKINNAMAFFVEQLVPAFQLNGAFGAAIDGTPLGVGGSSQLIANNTMPTLAHLRVNVSQTDRPWQNGGANDGVRLDSFGPDERSYLPFKVACAGNDTISVTVFNDGPTAVKGQLILRGHHRPYNAA